MARDCTSIAVPVTVGSFYRQLPPAEPWRAGEPARLYGSPLQLFGNRMPFACDDDGHVVSPAAEIAVQDTGNHRGGPLLKSRVGRQIPVGGQTVREHHDDGSGGHRVVELLDPSPQCAPPCHCGTPCCDERRSDGARRRRCCPARRSVAVRRSRSTDSAATAAPRVGRSAACTSSTSRPGRQLVTGCEDPRRGGGGLVRRQAMAQPVGNEDGRDGESRRRQRPVVAAHGLAASWRRGRRPPRNADWLAFGGGTLRATGARR